MEPFSVSGGLFKYCVKGFVYVAFDVFVLNCQAIIVLRIAVRIMLVEVHVFAATVVQQPYYYLS